jgi:ABC-type Na+ efflux pump permease subunit
MLPRRAIACCFALAAFAVALLAGLGAGADLDRTIGSAIIAMLACYALGFAIASAAAQAVKEAIESRSAPTPAAAPRPSEPPGTTA